MQRRRSGPQRFMASLLAILSTACYTYVPLEDGVRPNPGDEVRVHLADEGGSGSTSGPARRRGELQGLVVESGADSLVLSTRVEPSTAGTFERERREVVRLSYDEIQEIERPKVNGLLTGALVVGSLGALVGFMAIVLGAEDSGGPGDDGGGGPALDLRTP